MRNRRTYFKSREKNNLKDDYQLEKIDLCPLCGSLHRKQWNHYAEQIMAVSCDSCNLVYMNHRLADFEIERYYSSYNEKRNTVRPDLLEKRVRMYELDRRFTEIFIQKGSLLDYGCSSGGFIASLASSIEKFGFDIDETAINAGKVRHPEVTFYHNVKEFTGKLLFDCIVFRGTIQYQRNLHQTVKFCETNLKDGGYLIFLATPNADSPAARMQREAWVLFNRFEHLYYFTVETITTMFPRYERVYFDYPYIGTPYENQASDLDNFIAVCRGEKQQLCFPFWGSMMNVVLRKKKR